jgi:hypothetical protein
LILFFILILASCYKYFEWTYLKEVQTTYNKKLVQELGLLEQNKNLTNEAADLANAVFSSESELGSEESTKQMNDLIGKSRLLISNNEGYVQTITNNKDDISKLNDRSKYLFGSRVRFTRSLLNSQINYYENEEESAKMETVYNYLALNIFTILKDRAVLSIFEENIEKDPEKLIPQYYTDIAVLEKYSKNGFSFQDEENIKKYNPYGYESLQHNKDYMSSYFNVTKDFLAGDYESATYKLSRVNDAQLNLNIDFDRLTDEGKNSRTELAKKILENNYKKIKEIKNFKNTSLGYYPIVGNIGSWKDDLELCQLYQYKFEVINSISGSYPNALSVNELIKELSHVSPKDEEVDNLFNKYSIAFTNEEEQAKFVCTDLDSKKNFTFIVQK